MPTDAEQVRRLLCMLPDVVVPVAGSDRVIAADVEGDPEGTPVVLIHGTPDSRLARHPDISIVADLGIRLVAVDRPGFGHSTPDPSTTPRRFAADVAALLDHLHIDTAHLLAWSAGALWALGVAATIPDRVRSVTVVGGLVPFDAFGDSRVRDAAGPARLGMVETAEDLGADVAAEMIAPLLVPDPATPEAALEHRAEAGDQALSAIPGADAQMAAACCDAVRSGPAGLLRDVTLQLRRSDIALDGIQAPCRFVTGADDTTCPPEFARWFAARIAYAAVEIVPDAGHGLLLTHWRDVCAQVVQP